jgi:hypothetical protein
VAGQIVRLLPRTDFDASGMQSGLNTTVTIARKIDTSRWREAVLLVRLHAATWANAQFIQVLVAPDGFTDEDPGAIWNLTSTVVVTFTQGTDTVPSEKNIGVAAPFGPLMQVQLKFNNPVGASGTFKPSISIDLNLKGE